MDGKEKKRLAIVSQVTDLSGNYRKRKIETRKGRKEDERRRGLEFASRTYYRTVLSSVESKGGNREKIIDDYVFRRSTEGVYAKRPNFLNASSG